ncbi:MAG TPA: prephenate dehydrogenase/arogenate dehydrogenase family protein [Ktedonobacteraceae bacterium]|jgi:prephenate dehydrogenase|nr:prephenate dehydrogenase/arogenate dehydrogenase family protein [Ktedonobacteraceae bacterium]
MKRIAILGLGLIGGSLALAIRQANLVGQIAGYDAYPDAIRGAMERGAITHCAATAEEAVRQADVVILATPIGAMPALFERIAPALKPGTLVTDTASTKAQVIEWARRLLPAHAVFVGGHPMAGRECSGIEAADAGLFEGCTYCLTPAYDTPTAAVIQMSELVRGLAAQPLVLDAQEHDRLVAGVSHLPFVVSAALVRMLGQDEEWARMSQLAASGYRDMSRLAAGSPVMYRDICLTNREAIIDRIDALVMELASLRSLIATGDDTLEGYFAQSKEIRDGGSGSAF